MKNILLLFGIIIVFNSCGGSKKMPTVVEKNKPKKIVETIKENEKTEIKKTETKNIETKNTGVIHTSAEKKQELDVKEYITKYNEIAKNEMKKYGIPASITMAQGILESQSGKSWLAVESNNHFGIKCHGNNWQGKTILYDDDKAQECFRKYKSPEASFKDHSKFLANRKRYAFLFSLPKTDYEAWARGLKKAGYATDPAYPNKLIYIINKYNLTKLDKEVLSNKRVKKKEDNTEAGDQKKRFIYEVKKGETLLNIARNFNIPVKDIQRINNLNDFDIYEGQILVLTENNKEQQETIVYTEENNTPVNEEKTISQPDISPAPSNNTTEESQNTNEDIKLHTVKQGETLFFISRMYQVDINKLRQINGIEGNVIKIGSVVKIPKVLPPEIVNEPPVEKIEKKASVQEQPVYHIVQSGETLYRIHINYQVPVEKLRKLNHLKGNKIIVGQKLRVK